VAEFPRSPVPPSEFFESYLGKLFAAVALPRKLADWEASFGVRLEGEGGGEWLYTLRDGALAVVRGSRDGAAFTLVQSVEDWQGALWSGRGGAVAQRLGVLFGMDGAPRLLARLPRAAPALLERLAALGGVMRAVVTGGPDGDWSASVKFGPGEIPADPSTTISLHHDAAAALARRELGPVEAFLAGRVQVAGDVRLMMQLQSLLSDAAEALRGRR